MKQKKYTLTVSLNVKDIDTGEILDTQTEIEYFDTREGAEEARARYLAGDTGEYSDDVEISVISADVSEDALEVDMFT